MGRPLHPLTHRPIAVARANDDEILGAVQAADLGDERCGQCGAVHLIADDADDPERRQIERYRHVVHRLGRTERFTYPVPELDIAAGARLDLDRGRNIAEADPNVQEVDRVEGSNPQIRRTSFSPIEQRWHIGARSEPIATLAREGARHLDGLVLQFRLEPLDRGDEPPAGPSSLLDVVGRQHDRREEGEQQIAGAEQESEGDTDDQRHQRREIGEPRFLRRRWNLLDRPDDPLSNRSVKVRRAMERDRAKGIGAGLAGRSPTSYDQAGRAEANDLIVGYALRAGQCLAVGTYLVSRCAQRLDGDRPVGADREHEVPSRDLGIGDRQVTRVVPSDGHRGARRQPVAQARCRPGGDDELDGTRFRWARGRGCPEGKGLAAEQPNIGHGHRLGQLAAIASRHRQRHVAANLAVLARREVLDERGANLGDGMRRLDPEHNVPKMLGIRWGGPTGFDRRRRCELDTKIDVHGPPTTRWAR